SYEEGQGLRWDSGRGQGFSQGGIGLQDNQITIPETGLYFVYSQASFRVACHHQTRPQTRTQTRTQTRPQTRPQTAHQPGSDEEGRQRAPLSHRVGRFSESIGSEVSLMSAVRSPCSEHAAEAGRGWYNAIYLGAVFQLHKGDRLGTETNQLPELETDEGKTFFGVFALF
ncbi:tumor necrosis factor-like, partial [Eucyclogobius newberryi]|uniref:tumor necrosis factor-like n=1 Tax=Eucyclogobius newberryi TaxID=166745 RepID=UPI003B597655